VFIVTETAGQAWWVGCVRPEQDPPAAFVREVQTVGLLLSHNAHLTDGNGVLAKWPAVGEYYGHVTIPSVVIGGWNLWAGILAGVGASTRLSVFIIVITGHPEGKVAGRF